jgi:hypothetical protein
VVDELFQPPLKHRSFQHYSPPAAEAFQADVGAETSDLPVGAAAWVRSFEPYHVIEVQLQRRRHRA